jgi:outer membrane protein OmpA-like peptidoglycan-associated protein
MAPRFHAVIISLLFVALETPRGFSQPTDPGPAPIYRVSVVERTAKAINYEYQAEPTKVDFRGTVLLPYAKGEATIESRRGRTQINAKIDGLTAPQRFGREYLTYVLWAITPQGRPHNIGELLTNSSDKARIRVTTDLQAFALIVTAEPYSAVRQPGNVVVAENEVRPDTNGIVEPVEAKFELLPRGEYTWHVSSDLDRALADSPKVSMDEYEAMIELYQAQNAVGIAGTANAERYASEMFAKAKQLLQAAQRLHDSRAGYREVVRSAREAAQTAEDARIVAQRRQQAEQLDASNSALARTQAQLSRAQQEKEQALEEARQAQAEARTARGEFQVQTGAASRPQTESEAEEAEIQASNVQAARNEHEANFSRQRKLRLQLLDDMKNVLTARDTPRGLVVTLPDDAFHGAVLGTGSSERLAQLAGILSSRRDLRASVEGHSDSASRELLSQERADAARRSLIANGVAPAAVSAEGLGNRRPITSNATAEGRRANSCVEIVISGASIGDMPSWEGSYSLTRPAVPSASLP